MFKFAVQKYRQKAIAYGVPEYIEGQINTRQKKNKQFDFSSDSLFKHRKKLHFSHQSAKRILSHPLLVGDVAYFHRDKNKETIYIHNAYPEAVLLTCQKYKLLQASMENRT